MNIQNKDMTVNFDPQSGTAVCFSCPGNSDRYSGGDYTVSAVVRYTGDGTEKETDAVFLGSEETADGTAQKYRCCAGSLIAAEFSVVYAVNDGILSVSFGDVTEGAGFHLMEIRLDRLVYSIRSENPSFVSNRRGGYLSDLDHLNGDCNIVDDGEWKGYPNMSIFPYLAIIRKNSVCVMEVSGFVCSARLSFENDAVAMGVRAPYRIAGNGKDTPDLAVNQKEICRILFGGDVDGNGEVNWLDAAKLARRCLPPIPDRYFDDRMVYIIQNQLGRKPADLTYADTEKLIGRISRLLDGAPHVAMLTGWSQGGHDTSYPNIFTLNPALGTEEEFFALKKTAEEKYNCNVSLNDNFDDQYDNEFTKDGHFNRDNIERRADGTVETFLTWNGVDVSYITGMAKYMEDGGHGERRIDWEGGHYGVKKAMLIDALSWWSIRHNWNPEFPASAVDNIRAKYKIIDRFKEKYDVNILSELVRYPFIGKLCVAFDNNVCFWTPTDNDVPFLRVAVKDSMYYGQKAGDALDLTDFLYHNSAKHPWFRKDETSERITDIYYLNYVPWFVVHSLDVTDYSCRDGKYDIGLEGGYRIFIDYPARRWKITSPDNVIMKDNSISCPMSGNRIAFYTKDGGKLSYRIPDGAVVKSARRLYDTGAEECGYDLDGNTVTVECPANTPVIVSLA